MFHRVEIINSEKEIHIRLDIDQGFTCDAERGVHTIEVFAESEVEAETKIVQTFLITHHDEGDTEVNGTMRRSWRTRRRS